MAKPFIKPRMEAEEEASDSATHDAESSHTVYELDEPLNDAPGWMTGLGNWLADPFYWVKLQLVRLVAWACEHD